MQFEFLAAARAELEEAFDHYEMERTGLGDEFLLEVYRTVQRILKHPLAWSRLSRRTRRCRAKRFPYGLIYQVTKDRVLIVAVMHLGRRPNYWRDRLR